MTELKVSLRPLEKRHFYVNTVEVSPQRRRLSIIVVALMHLKGHVCHMSFCTKEEGGGAFGHAPTTCVPQ
jgi:hypothetical protein